MYTVFKRNFWKANPAYPNGREPNPHARKTRLAVVSTEEEAVQWCREWNATNNPGKLSMKAEYTAGGL